MTKKYFIELAKYNNWTDDIIMDWISQISERQWEQNIESSFSTIKETVIHIVSAKKIWLDFWLKKPKPTYLSANFEGNKQGLILIWKKASSDLEKFVHEYPESEYKQPVTVYYPNGKKVEMAFWKTLPHFVNHATYHRGQLVTMLRQSGFSDFKNTDLFTYFIVG
jgi:uncharacterized damage-inducible protein DinB